MNQISPAKFDIAILGGGIVGSATAYFLLQESPGLSICVIEPDPTYEFASTLRASGGCRVQFTCPENIAMSLYSIGFIKAFEQTMVSNGRPAPVDWVEAASSSKMMVKVKMDPRLRGDDDALSMIGDDPRAAIRTGSIPARAVVRSLWDERHWIPASAGKTALQGVVLAAEVDGGSARAVVLSSGERVAADAFVNAAGAWSGVVAAMFGMKLPVTPMRRFEHYFTAGSAVERLPYVKDVARLAFRSEGKGFSGGRGLRGLAA